MPPRIRPTSERSVPRRALTAAGRLRSQSSRLAESIQQESTLTRNAQTVPQGSSPSYGSLERQADHASSELRNVNPTPLNGGNRPRPLSVNSAVHLYKRLRPQGVAYTVMSPNRP